MKAATITRIGLWVLLGLFLLAPQLFAGLLEPLARNNAPVLYNQGSLFALALIHLALTGGAIILASIVAVGFAILVTRPFGAEFLPLSRSIANIGQTFTPVAVLALTVPALGFGSAPTLVALFLYGLLPIFENTLAGLTNVPASVREASRAMGMTPRQRLFQVELPLASPVILAGIRVSTVISLGTATIGSTVAARTLGEVIIAGLLTNNIAFIVQGGAIVGLLAILIHDALMVVERRLAR
jgi:osmoprotectant transport system permease protein